jgi:hypothetical protein
MHPVQNLIGCGAPQPRHSRRAIALAYREQEVEREGLINSTFGSASSGEARDLYDEPFIRLALG